MNEIIVTFLSHYDAISFYTKYQEEYAEVNVLPVPRNISSSCGSCVRLVCNISDIDFENVDFECVYRIEESKYIKVIESE